MKQENGQPIESIKKSNNILIIIVFLIVVFCGYAWQQIKTENNKQELEQQIFVLQNEVNQLKNIQLTQDQSIIKQDQQDKSIESATVSNTVATPANQKSNWRTYNNNQFSYKCPTDWSLNQNLNYNGQVGLSECSKIYSGKISFDDGVSVTFGFVPQSVADKYEVAGQKWSDTLLYDVKNEPNAQEYSNNNFIGWVSMKNQKHTLKLIARHKVDGGYYELLASAMGGTKTDQEFKNMIDDIISTFFLK